MAITSIEQFKARQAELNAKEVALREERQIFAAECNEFFRIYNSIEEQQFRADNRTADMMSVLATDVVAEAAEIVAPSANAEGGN